MVRRSGVQGAKQVMAALKGLEREAHRAKSSVVVGYTQNYAIFVHENTEAYHEHGQAKYLEHPLRQNKDRYAALIIRTYKQTGSMLKALLMAGLALQRDSQKLCPVDTGALRASAFTRKDDK